jgi:hypothetical protein
VANIAIVGCGVEQLPVIDPDDEDNEATKSVSIYQWQSRRGCAEFGSIVADNNKWCRLIQMVRDRTRQARMGDPAHDPRPVNQEDAHISREEVRLSEGWY